MTAAGASPDRLLDGLNEEQREVTTTLLGPVRVLAGAGTGKTTALTRRLAYGIATGVYDPRAVMALTFTTKAAGEMRTRLSALGVPAVAARTFHSAALAQLRHFWPQIFGGRVPALADSKSGIIREAAEGVGIDIGRASAREIAAEIEWRKVRNLSIDDYAATERPAPAAMPEDGLIAIMRRYERLKLERRVMDFEDVLLATLGILQNEPTVAAQVHAIYRVFVVDEYQDVSPVQQALLDAWLGNRKDVCVVGDVSQTIYSFAGASMRPLLDFDTRYPGAHHIEMVRNYRSTQSIVATANAVMKGEEGAVELRSETRGGPPLLREFDSDEAEAAWVAASIAAARGAGEDALSVAVLARVGAQLPIIEQALAAAGVPYRLRDGPNYFARPEVATAMLLLNVAAAGQSAEAPSLAHAVAAVLLEAGYTARPPEGVGAERDAWEALAALLRLAEQKPEGTTLAAFVDELLRRKAAQDAPPMRAVTVSTIHSAKGLEWDTVYLIGLADGLLPVRRTDGAEAITEERRLFYVAVTRARRRLVMSWAARGEGRRRRAPSPFLGLVSSLCA